MKTRTYTHLYVVRCLQTGIHKIGITGDWQRRSRSYELAVGIKTESVRVARINNPPQLEKWLHKRYHHCNLPQTEYFNLSAAELQQVLAAVDKAASDYQNAAAKQQQTQRPMPQRVPAPVTPRPTPAAIPQQQQEDRMRTIRQQQAAADRERRTADNFAGWYKASFLALACAIAAVGGMDKPSSWFIGALNASYLAFPVGYALSAASQKQ